MKEIINDIKSVEQRTENAENIFIAMLIISVITIMLGYILLKHQINYIDQKISIIVKHLQTTEQEPYACSDDGLYVLTDYTIDGAFLINNKTDRAFKYDRCVPHHKMPKEIK